MNRSFTRIEGDHYVCDHCSVRGKVTKSRFPAETVMHDCQPMRVAATTPGPGTILKGMFARRGIFQTNDCGCGRIQEEMDFYGPQWCRDNEDNLLDRIRERAKQRKLLGKVPFPREYVRRLMRVAVRKAERLQRKAAA